MKQVIVFLIAFMLITSFCKSQTTSGVVTGNYIGQSVADRMVMSIEVKKGQKYLLKTYDLNKKLQKKVKGKWTIEGDKLVLKGNSGTIMILEKYKDTWYLADKMVGSA